MKKTWLLTSAACVILTTACSGLGSNLKPEAVASAQRVNGVPYAAGGTSTGTGVGQVGGTSTDPGTATTTPRPGAATSGGPGTSGTPGSAGSTTESGGGSPTGVSSPTGFGPVGSCAGFKNSTGITDKTITVGNVADISGPAPGAFQQNVDATRAFIEYFNSTSTICGRKLALTAYDGQTTSSGGQQAYIKGCSQVFAMVGSSTLFDDGGASEAQHCGLPDVRAGALTAQRVACTTCFADQVNTPNTVQNALFDYFRTTNPASTKSAAIVYLDLGPIPVEAKAFQKAANSRGFNVKIMQPIDIAEFNYASYVQKLKDAGIKWVLFAGADSYTVRFAQAMQQAGYKPDAFVGIPANYDSAYLTTGGKAVDGTYVWVTTAQLESNNPEVNLYKTWVRQVAPGDEVLAGGLNSWAAARLFVQEAVRLGGKLNRATLVAALRGVHGFTANGIQPPEDVGRKTTSPCLAVLQDRSSTWIKVSSGDYLCTGLTKSG